MSKYGFKYSLGADISTREAIVGVLQLYKPVIWTLPNYNTKSINKDYL